jgi:hypothetical protein
MILCFIASFITIPKTYTCTPLEPVVIIALDNPVEYAQVGPEDLGVVEFRGTVTATFSSSTSIIVTLSAKDTWNNADVAPSAISFSSSDNSAKTFSVTIHVPNGTSMDTVGNVEVDGTWTMYPSTVSGDCDSVEGRIEVRQFFDYEIKADTILKETTQGDDAKFSFNIKNAGNGNDMITMGIRNSEQLNDLGFKVTLSTSRFSLTPNQNEVMYVHVEAPDNKRIRGEYSIMIEIASETNSQSISELTFKVKVNPKELISTEDVYLIIIIILIIIISIILLWVWKSRKKGRME